MAPQGAFKEVGCLICPHLNADDETESERVPKLPSNKHQSQTRPGTCGGACSASHAAGLSPGDPGSHRGAWLHGTFHARLTCLT